MVWVTCHAANFQNDGEYTRNISYFRCASNIKIVQTSKRQIKGTFIKWKFQVYTYTINSRIKWVRQMWSLLTSSWVDRPCARTFEQESKGVKFSGAKVITIRSMIVALGYIYTQEIPPHQLFVRPFHVRSTNISSSKLFNSMYLFYK